MDSGDSQPNFNDSPNNPHSSNSAGLQCQTPIAQPNSFVDLDQFYNGTIPLNLRSQRTFPNNSMSVQFSSQSQQQYAPGFSYQGLLNAQNVVYVPATSQPSKASQKRQKTSQSPETTQATTVRRWTLPEDIALINARLHVSSDADVGTGQKSEALWSRILQVWRENMENFDVTRDSNSLECRWGRLQGAINKFHGCYERAERLKKSGTTLEDVKRAALRFYQETNNNQTFKHEECWEICRKNAKWCTKQLTKQDASRKHRSVVDSSKENPQTSTQTQIDPSLAAGSSSAFVNDGIDPKTVEAEKLNDEGVTRPDDGRNAVKDQKRKVVAEKVVADALGNVQSSLERQLELSRVDLELKKARDKKDYELREKIFKAEIELKERNQKMKEKAQTRKEQERILEKDLTMLAPNVRVKYEMMQAQILKEWEKNGFFGEVSGTDNSNI